MCTTERFNAFPPFVGNAIFNRLYYPDDLETSFSVARKNCAKITQSLQDIEKRYVFGK